MSLEELLGFGLAARAIAEELGRAYLAVEQATQARVAAEKAKTEAESKLAERTKKDTAP